MELSIRYNDDLIRKIEEKMKRLAEGQDSKDNDLLKPKEELKEGIPIPNSLHLFLQSIPEYQKELNGPFLKKIITSALSNLEVVKRVNEITATLEIQKRLNADATQKSLVEREALKELRAFENTLFKDTVHLQKDLTLVSKIDSLTGIREDLRMDLQKFEKEGPFKNTAKKEEIKTLKSKVDEISVAIQHHGEILSVKELLPGHKKTMGLQLNATIAVSDVVRKTIETVSQIEHAPVKQYQPVRLNVMQHER